MKKDIHWHIGCSGFHYREWKSVFYPEKMPQRSWFEYYSSQFNTLELNSSFYQFPKLKSLQNWYEKSPPGFLFSLKVPRLITHFKKFNDTGQLLEDFYTVVKAGLADKTGAILFQLPPQLQYSNEMLENIIQSTNPEFSNVIEFRHASWWKQEVYEKLEANNIGFCSISYPKLPDEPVFSKSVPYYRFHGVPVLYKSLYDATFLQRVADFYYKNQQGGNVFIYFNNTWGTAAIENARWLIGYCETSKDH